MLRYLSVGLAISNITPLYLYSDPSKAGVMTFTLAMLCELMISMGSGLELYYNGLGDKVSIQNHTLDDFKFGKGPLFVLYLAAFIFAAVQYQYDLAHEANEEDKYRAATPPEDVSEEADVLLSSIASWDWDMHDLPMTLTAVSYFLRLILSIARLQWWRKNCDFRSRLVPANIDYLIHRYGEFIMLMIGEGVLSLLIVEVIKTKEYYGTVICGLLTMIVIFLLKTQSEPMNGSKHAL